MVQPAVLQAANSFSVRLSALVEDDKPAARLAISVAQRHLPFLVALPSSLRGDDRPEARQDAAPALVEQQAYIEAAAWVG